jgi:hypothetical protein
MAKKVSLCLTCLIFFVAIPMLLSAQDNMGMGGGKQAMSVTGCLKQGSDTGGYYIMGQDGKMYELMGKGLGAHLNHTVTVTGMQVKLSEAQEQKKEASEKTEAGASSYVDMKVSDIKMVSTNCQADAH